MTDVDALIRALIARERIATESDVGAIVAAVAESPFATRLIGVPEELRGHEYLGDRFGLRAPSWLVHLAKRVVVEQQWREGTTFDEYLHDLRTAVLHRDRRVTVFRRRGAAHVGVLSLNTVPAERLAQESESHIWVVYASQYGTITSGYQVSGIQRVSLPEDALWLTHKP